MKKKKDQNIFTNISLNDFLTNDEIEDLSKYHQFKAEDSDSPSMLINY